jgi:hypothetical protein
MRQQVEGFSLVQGSRWSPQRPPLCHRHVTTKSAPCNGSGARQRMEPLDQFLEKLLPGPNSSTARDRNAPLFVRH